MLYALEVPPAGGNTSFCSMYAVYEALPDALKQPHREPEDQARRHLQQRRLSAPGRHRDRRSAHLAGRRASAGLHPSRHRPAHALSRPPPQRLSGRARARGVRGAARRALGLRRRARNSPGSTSGGSAISCCGTIAAPCTGATRSMPRRAASCTAPRSRAARRRSDAQVQRLQHGPADHLPDVPDPLCGSGQHLDRRAADQGGPRLEQYRTRPGVFGVRLSVCAVPADRRLYRRQVRRAPDAVRQRSDRVRGDGGNRRGRRTGRACSPRGSHSGSAKARPSRPRRARWRHGCRSAVGVSPRASPIRPRGSETR